MRIVTTRMELSNWHIDPGVTDDAFTPKNAGSAKPIPFSHPNKKLPAVEKAEEKGKPSKIQEGGQ